MTSKPEPSVTLHDKTFHLYISHAQIQERITAIAKTIDAEYQGKRPLFITVLNGAFMFAADLARAVTIDCEWAFVRLSSYQGTESTGTVSQVLGLKDDVEGRHVIVVEDIVDSGRTMANFLPELEVEHPASIAIATLLFKPEALKHEVQPDHVCFETGNEFVVGYGLDYDELGRNLPDIYRLQE